MRRFVATRVGRALKISKIGSHTSSYTKYEGEVAKQGIDVEWMRERKRVYGGRMWRDGERQESCCSSCSQWAVATPPRGSWYQSSVLEGLKLQRPARSALVQPQLIITFLLI